MKNNTIFLLFIFSLGIVFCHNTYAQTDTEYRTVSGQIVDKDNEPVAKAKVITVLAKNVVETGENGEFTVEISGEEADFLRVVKKGYESQSMFVSADLEAPIVLQEAPYLYGTNDLKIPYLDLKSSKNVSAINTITGEELRTFPSIQFLEALEGRLPGLTMSQNDYTPGAEWVTGLVRGEPAIYYIDGIQRNPRDLTVYEIDKVEVIKDFSGRATLGISGASPIVWITTIKGQENKNEINITAETGYSEAANLPNYLDSYNYATLYNEALANDGLDPLYSQEALDAYQTGNNTLRYPNVDYYDRYVKDFSRFTRANVDFQGGSDKVTYFSNLNYVGSGGYEEVGQETTYDRYKIRGNVDIKLTDFMRMNINLSGTYGRAEFPNQGDGAARYNMFSILSSYPSNATPIWYEDQLIVSDNYPVNLTNELVYGGYAESTELNTQNLVSLLIDLESVAKGLEFYASAALDANNVLVNNLGGTAALYRRVTGTDNELERVVEQEVQSNMYNGDDSYDRRISAMANLSYKFVKEEHDLDLDLSYYQSMQENRVVIRNYQPDRIQDLGFRANYLYDGKYALQFDASYTGNMRLPDGERFNFYPTVGAAWNVSEESFLKNSNVVDYLKLYSSYGIMGVNNFNFGGTYNPYYLYETLWQNVGTWTSGIEGQRSGADNIYEVLQYGSTGFSLPERQYFNIGFKSEFFDRKIALEANYFDQKDVDILSPMSNFTPSIYGTGGFLPIQNFEEFRRYGVDGMVQYNDEFGDFKVSLGVNAMYLRSENLVVDEPAALAEYRQRAGNGDDVLFGYNALGLYQSQSEIDSRGVTQSWGTLAPGDIMYEDYNNDGVITEQDIHAIGHAPRIAYGINISLAYKGFDLFVSANGRANGEVMLNGTYFQNNTTNNNYSEAMLDRWPVSNNMPRLTTVSQNNYQTSSFWLEDGAYLNLRNVQLGYTFPNSISRKLNMQELKLFLRGRNLASFSKIHSEYGLNPEYLSLLGINAYPISRTLTFGLSTKF